MKNPSSAFQATIAGDAMAPILLVDFDATTAVRYAFYPQDVTFNSEVYTATDGKIGALQQNADGRAPSTVLTMQNVDRTMRDWLDAADRRGTELAVRIVFADDLSDATSLIEIVHDLDGYRFDHADVELDLVASPVLRGTQVPGRRVQGWYCPWSYQGDECAYVGALTSCDFTYFGKNGCRQHFGTSDPKRFGGFLGRPQADLVVR